LVSLNKMSEMEVEDIVMASVPSTSKHGSAEAQKNKENMPW